MTNDSPTRPWTGDPYRPPVTLAPDPPPPRRRRNWWAKVEPEYRILAAGASGVLIAAIVLRCCGITAWWAAVAAAGAAMAAGWVTSERGGNRRIQAETAALVAAAGGWLVFVTALGPVPHRPGMGWLTGVPVFGYLIGVSAVGALLAHRENVKDRAVKAARAGGRTGSEQIKVRAADFDPAPATRPEPAPRPAPARPGPDEGAVTEIAAVSGVRIDRVRVVWAHLTEHGQITGPVAGELIGKGDETGRRMLRDMEQAQYVRKTGPKGEQVYEMVRSGGLLRSLPGHGR